jgi:peroxiredoxin
MRKALLIVSIGFIVLFGSLQLYLSTVRPTDQDELREKVTRFPALQLHTTDGKPYTLPGDKRVIVVYFNSTCDHCARQLKSLNDQAASLEGRTLLLMSSQQPDELAAFAASLRFPSTTDVHVVHVRAEDVAEKFGVLALPQIFVYDAKGNLAGLFAGETSPQVILSALK